MEWFYTTAYARDEIEAITWWDLSEPAFIKTSGFLGHPTGNPDWIVPKTKVEGGKTP